MAEAPRNATHGKINAGATEVKVDMTTLGTDVPIWVTLTTDYAMLHAPGMLARPSFTGCAAASLQYPRTLPSGTRFQVFKNEATALVAAGAAVLS